MLFTSNKQIRGQFERWQDAMADDTGRYVSDIFSAYEKPSIYKTRAWDRCVEMMNSYDGYGFIILGHNCMQFSVGFIGYIDGLKHFFYITRDYDRAMPLEKMDENTGEVIAIYPRTNVEDYFEIEEEA